MVLVAWLCFVLWIWVCCISIIFWNFMASAASFNCVGNISIWSSQIFSELDDIRASEILFVTFAFFFTLDICLTISSHRNPQVKDLGTCLLSKGNLWVFPLFLIAHTNCVYFFDPVTHSNMNKPQVLILCRVNRVKIILLVGFKYSLVSLICILVIQLNSNRLRKYGTVLTKSFSIQGTELFKLFFF